MNLIAENIRRITEVEHLQAIRELLTNIMLLRDRAHCPVPDAITTLDTYAFHHWRPVSYVGEKMPRQNKVVCCSVTAGRVSCNYANQNSLWKLLPCDCPGLEQVHRYLVPCRHGRRQKSAKEALASFAPLRTSILRTHLCLLKSSFQKSVRQAPLIPHFTHSRLVTGHETVWGSDTFFCTFGIFCTPKKLLHSRHCM